MKKSIKYLLLSSIGAAVIVIILLIIITSSDKETVSGKGEWNNKQYSSNRFSSSAVNDSYNNDSSYIESITVPDFIGEYYSEVIDRYEYSTRFSFVRYEQESDEEEGKVIYQYPNAGTIVDNYNCTVYLTVSIAKQTVTIPNVVGKTQQLAEEEMSKLNLSVLVEYTYNSYPKGTVIASFPKANTTVNSGTTVTIYVSLGSNTASGNEESDSSSEFKGYDTMYFGHYEQDNNTANGKEPIEWLILERDGNRVLLLSKRCLAFKEYNSEYTYVTWGTCSLRKWLNSSFIIDAFSSEEQTKIQYSNVDPSDNTKYSVNGGQCTYDKVYILSDQETREYFSNDSLRQAFPSASCSKEKGENGYTNTINCTWWTRTPGHDQNFSMCVDERGSADDYYGYNVKNKSAVRPVICIELG